MSYDLELRSLSLSLRNKPEYKSVKAKATPTQAPFLFLVDLFVQKVSSFKQAVADAKSEVASIEKTELTQGNSRFKGTSIAPAIGICRHLSSMLSLFVCINVLSFVLF